VKQKTGGRVRVVARDAGTGKPVEVVGRLAALDPLTLTVATRRGEVVFRREFVSVFERIGEAT
jgi:hypothetical protein